MKWTIVVQAKSVLCSGGRMRDVLLKECYDGLLVGRGGANCTTTFLKESYYWPNLKDDAEEYVKTF